MFGENNLLVISFVLNGRTLLTNEILVINKKKKEHSTPSKTRSNFPPETTF